ncbi:Unknown protein [Striga hermonthica]|uniref:F-box domain-containing protein n=1 Tax=Striga hermonthica TaxID=68872 RepID=A0A9N7RFP4_STRHE|nr:Unknown protein [Striga hermonthica]
MVTAHHLPVSIAINPKPWALSPRVICPIPNAQLTLPLFSIYGNRRRASLISVREDGSNEIRSTSNEIWSDILKIHKTVNSTYPWVLLPPAREPLPMIDIPPSMVRQPPPPRRPGKEESNTEVEPFKFLAPPVHQQIYYRRRCKRKRVTTDIESLPHELLIEVLARIPPGRQHDIYEARLVCRKWYNIIHTRNFMSAYLHHSPYGLLFKSVCILPQRGGVGVGVEMTQLSYKPRCEVTSSCNGLWLETNMKERGRKLFVTNPTTGQIVCLPPCVRKVSKERYAMGYAPASMEYKAVIYYPPRGTRLCPRPTCHILTVGVDKKWRNLDLGLISSEKAITAFFKPPLITEGFIHWNHPHTHHVLTLNVETETFTETPAPLPPLQDFPARGRQTNIYLSTGKYLTLLSHYGRECSWEVWEMSRPETGEWRKKAHFCLEVHKERFEISGVVPKDFFLPVGWVKYPELLAMRVSGNTNAVFVYNLVTQEIDEIGLPSYVFRYSFVVHKSSLEWIDAVKPTRRLVSQ